MSPTLLTGDPSPRKEWSYYGQPGNLWAARAGNFKLVFESWESLGTEKQIGWRGYGNHLTHDPPLLFDLSTDPAERWDTAKRRPEAVERIRQAIERHRQHLAQSRGQ